jgi:hypothetical protein
MGVKSRAKYLREYRRQNRDRVRAQDRERQRDKRRLIAPFAELFKIWLRNLNEAAK